MLPQENVGHLDSFFINFRNNINEIEANLQKHRVCGALCLKQERSPQNQPNLDVQFETYPRFGEVRNKRVLIDNVLGNGATRIFVPKETVSGNGATG